MVSAAGSLLGERRFYGNQISGHLLLFVNNNLCGTAAGHPVSVNLLLFFVTSNHCIEEEIKFIDNYFWFSMQLKFIAQVADFWGRYYGQLIIH